MTSFLRKYRDEISSFSVASRQVKTIWPTAPSLLKWPDMFASLYRLELACAFFDARQTISYQKFREIGSVCGEHKRVGPKTRRQRV
jgi:hypothetical protein